METQVKRQSKEQQGRKQPIAEHGRVPECGYAQSTAASVPILGVHEKYQLLETYKNAYVKLYLLEDNNYLTAPVEEQQVIYQGWKSLINSLGTGVEASLFVYNHKVDVEAFCEKVVFKETGDGLDYLRKEENEIILRRIQEGRGGTRKEKGLAVTVHAGNPKLAARAFRHMEQNFQNTLSQFGSGILAVPLEEGLDMLYGIYNNSEEHLIQKIRMRNEAGEYEEISSFDYDHIRSMGLSINDMICPTSLTIKRDYLQMGGKYARTLRVSKIANKMSDSFLNTVTEKDFEYITSIHFEAISPRRAEAIVAQNLSFIRDQKTKQIRAGQKQNIFDDSFVNPEILDREAEALALRDALRGKDEQLFDTVMTVTVFAESKEKLEEYTENLVTEYKKASFTLSVMNGQQEEGFQSTIPLCCNHVKLTRTLTTSSLALFIPFSTLELNDPEGINYSSNILSKNPIFWDRMKGSNYNGFILGTSGTGKSFAAKLEMLAMYLRARGIIFVVDPEAEYTDLAEVLHGQVVVISPSSNTYINLMAIYVPEDYDGELDLVNEKVGSILQIMECILKSPFGINSVQEALIDECVHKLFAPFMVNGRLRPISDEEMPTLTDLCSALELRQEPEARELVYALKVYTGDGSLSVFGHKTNVEINNRFVVFQIRDVGERLKNLAMLVILEHLWNEILKNRKLGITTCYYIDEIYLLFQNEFSANYLNTMVRRGRKYGAVFTGISQNVTPILENPVARDMLQNCNFIQILGQAGPDRESLKRILNLSEANLEYITNSPPGQGLIYTGKNVVPFGGSISKETQIYKLLTSNPRERQEYREQMEAGNQ